jgi:hypothetical protein
MIAYCVSSLLSVIIVTICCVMIGFPIMKALLIGWFVSITITTLWFYFKSESVIEE